MPSVLHVLPHRGGGAETYVDILEALDGYRHRRVALSATREPFGAAASIALGAPRLVRAARAADVVHAHGDVATLLATPLLRARPAVVTTHGLHLLRRSNGARGSAVRRALRVALGGVARVLCTSAAERDQLAAFLPSALARRLVVAHNAVPAALEPSAAERERARHGLGLAPGDVVALYLGQLEARKRPLDAARAAIAARAGGAPIVLIVAGDGPQRGEL